MSRRLLLVGLLVAATGAFVVGTALERHQAKTHHDTPTPAAAAGGGETHAEAGGESAAHRAAEGTTGRATETHAELKPLGIDVEAAPFVALAAAASLALAAAVWLRPSWLALLVLAVAAMLVFAVLDIREVVHQSDESRTGLAVLAAAVAALHLAAAAVAGLMGRDAARGSEAAASGATMAG